MVKRKAHYWIAVVFSVCFFVSISQTGYNLQKAMLAAKSNNLILRSQNHNIQMAEADLITARLRPNPILNNQSLQLVQSSYFPANTTWQDGRNRQVWWQLTKPFLMPGVRKNKIELAEKNIRLQEQVYSESERNFLRLVANKWIDAWFAGKQKFSLHQVKIAIDSMLFKKEAETPLEIIRAEIVIKQFNLQLKAAEQHYESEVTDLQLMLGTAEKVEIDTSAVFHYNLFSSPDSIVAQALLKRSDILSLKYAEEAAGSQIKLQKKLAYPTPELGFIYNPQNTIPYVGFFGTLQIPIFARNQGEIKKADIVKLQAGEILNYHLVQAKVELSRALSAYNHEKSNMKDHAELFAQGAAVFNGLTEIFKSKGTSTIEFAEAQKGWLEIQIQYYESIRNYMRSSVQLLYASGMIDTLAR